MSEQTLLTIRPYCPADLPALVEVINRAVEIDQEPGQTTLEDLQHSFERPYFYPEHNCLIAELDGRVVGMCTAELDPRVGQGWGSGRIHPDFRRQGIGRRLLHAAEARYRERAETELTPDLPLIVTRYCNANNTGASTLLAQEGYTIVRVSWFMRIDLDAPIDPPPLPEGIMLRPFDRARDAEAVHEAETEFFRENWGILHEPFDLWQQIRFGTRFDPALWLVAWDGDQIAGLCLGLQPAEGQDGIGWVETLAVRKDWRGRGIGSALLRHGFRVLQEQGYPLADLEVDSENRTNAVGLYERAGMRVHRRFPILRKALRGDPALIWQ